MIGLFGEDDDPPLPAGTPPPLKPKPNKCPHPINPRGRHSQSHIVLFGATSPFCYS